MSNMRKLPEIDPANNPDAIAYYSYAFDSGQWQTALKINEQLYREAASQYASLSRSESGSEIFMLEDMDCLASDFETLQGKFLRATLDIDQELLDIKLNVPEDKR